MVGLFADKLGSALLDEAGIAPSQMCRTLTVDQSKRLVQVMKHFCVPITATRSFEQAQVTAGGVSLQEIHMETMESKIQPGHDAGLSGHNGIKTDTGTLFCR